MQLINKIHLFKPSGSFCIKDWLVELQNGPTKK
jgi:hypothetical protein